MKHTKIICTIGPASQDIAVMRKLVEHGANIFRVNFSHGTDAEHERVIQGIRALRQEMGVPLGILLDTQGPEIRTGLLKDGPVVLEAGQAFVLTARDVPGDKHAVSVSHKGLPRDVQAGATILLDDGLVELRVERVEEGTDIHCTVQNGGELGERKGVNVPLCAVSLPSVAEKDIRDLQLGVRLGVDFVAASFVRSAVDVMEVRRVLEEAGDDSIHVIAKIENAAAVENFDEILKVSDGVMIARGDLGVEIPMEEVPVVQKRIIRACNAWGRPVITATQMLDSMIRNPRPTRAEVTDVANAIYDGTDAIMLSGETAAGRYPVQSLKTMARIACKAEEEVYAALWQQPMAAGESRHTLITEAVSFAACSTARDVDAKAILTPTQSGHTALMVSKYRPWPPILATTMSKRTYNTLTLVWGCLPLKSVQYDTTDEMVDQSVAIAVHAGAISAGDVVVITGGLPTKSGGVTNLMKVHVVGDILLRGKGLGTQAASGRARIMKGKFGKNVFFEKGDVLVAKSTDDSMLALMKKASAIITEDAGLPAHAATVGKLLGIPVIIAAEGARHALPDGIFITVDPASGFVYNQLPKIEKIDKDSDA